MLGTQSLRNNSTPRFMASSGPPGSSSAGSSATVVSQTNPSLGVYAQDEWKVRPNLTLNANFATGMSSGRTIVKDATSYAVQPVIWHDTCGHGTRLASVIAGPRNGQSILGVAWGAKDRKSTRLNSSH